ncbi:DNA-binding transcriptional regulator, LysR family [Cellulosimicrobium aquatile]|uniref:LysR family transcriptional regulator n=2 Tax=Cellulosimicrobium TaxID=157920 RepID=A0A4Y8R591_9MICO|nr:MULTISPECIES: LysR substrate-binding domain-containing protein [Cellulosimicrobium]TFF16657.1 LysR family transcriptional regulator [Cellulosimicrobium funkei]TGA78513.1 LysR family transcriptional regulator [Cellulosimicrobium terreum]UTT57652.1 LysR substrate-binding domain-containing protein [Cellulosimicrobium cellulans]SIQ30422.1 DNA-binding transcriptional regulator, LysR family [Cellulosimicrobium aquatile]
MDLTRLRVLAAVAREGSVTGAARALHYAQPSVSHHLARLEAEVGVPLTERHGRGVRLTAAGRLLAARADEILGRVGAAREELDALVSLSAGRVRLAAFPSALATLVPDVVGRLAREHPGLGVGLVEAEPPEALDALRRGAVDVALVFEHDRSPLDVEGLRAVPVLAEELFLVRAGSGPQPGTDPGRDSATDEAAASSGEVDLAPLADAAWIAGCERCRADLVGRCERAGFTPRVAFETDDYVAVQALVASGVGVSLLPALALRAHRDPRVTVRALPGAARRVLVVTYGERRSPGAAAVVEGLVRAAG